MDTPIIVNDPNVMDGKPLIRGTHYTVEFILEQLADGVTMDALVQQHQLLTREAIRAALLFAKEELAVQRFYPARQTA